MPARPYLDVPAHCTCPTCSLPGATPSCQGTCSEGSEGGGHGKFVLTDDRSMIDWGAFGAPRRVDCDDLYRQPQTALQHRRISLCVRPAVREEEVAMVR